MSFYTRGNPPINSTYATVSAPSTSTLIAELDSTQLGTANYRAGFEQNHILRMILGASTTATWQIEHANSTALASPLETVNLYTATGQSAQFIWCFRLGKDSRLRARLASTAALATANFSAEVLS